MYIYDLTLFLPLNAQLKFMFIYDLTLFFDSHISNKIFVHL